MKRFAPRLARRFAPIAGLVAAALLGGCAVYPDGTPMYGNSYGGGYSDYQGYDGYATGVPVVPQTNVYMGYGNYSGPGYYDGPGPGRYYGPGPGYGGYPDRGQWNGGNGYHGNGNGNGNGGWQGQTGGGRGGPPPQGAAGGPRGPSGSSAPRPGAGGPPPAPPPQQAGNQGGRGNGGGGGGAPVRGVPGRQSGQPTEH